MKKKKVCIFNENSRAAVYGIGTYIDQLTTVLKDSDLEFNLIYLYAKGTEVRIEEKGHYKQISIPGYKSVGRKNDHKYYTRNVVYLLKEFLPEDKETEYVFHLNFMTNEYLVRHLKKTFRCKTILVSHYTNWSFALFGNYSKLKKIVNIPKKALKEHEERAIVEGVKEDLKMIKKVDRFVCVAEHTLKAFKQIENIPSEKTSIVNNALADTYVQLSNDERLQLKKKYCINEQEKIIVFAGRLDEVKGIAYLIQAFKKTLELYPNAHLFILGDGNYNLWLKESTDCWSRITFTGRLDKERLYDFYHIADVGIVCSLHEEFGFVAIEMMMHTLPIIVTKTGGLDEIVEDTGSGLKVPVRTIKGKRQVDVKVLADKMCFLLENPIDAKELGENGRKRFLEKYELSLFGNKMLNLYNTI